MYTMFYLITYGIVAVGLLTIVGIVVNEFLEFVQDKLRQ